MVIEQEFYFWKTVHELVVVHDFDLLHIHSREREVWLEKNHKWTTHVVRVAQKQVNWRNELKREVLITIEQIKHNKQLFNRGKVKVHTLFVSEYPPVEEWEGVASELPMQKLEPEVYILSDDHKFEEKKRFLETFDRDPLYEQYPSPDEMEAMIPYLKQQIVTKFKQKKQEAASLFQFGKPVMTYVLFFINLVMFYLLEINGGSTNIETLIQYGAKYNPAILEGEWWRIGSSMFLHIGFLHLAMNMLALFYLGSATERIYGSIRFTGIYFLAGLFGGLASFMLNANVAAGASGAIFGLFGALLYFGVRKPGLFFKTMGWNLIVVIGINIAFGLMVPQIDNSAHVGGLIGGFLAAAVFHLPKGKKPFAQTMALVAYTVLVAAMAVLGYQSVWNGDTAFAKVQDTVTLNQEGAYDETIAITTSALEDPGPYEAQLLFNRSFAYLNLGEYEEAEDDLLSAVEIAPELPEAHYNLSVLYARTGEREKAISHLETAIELSPENEDFQAFYEELMTQ